MSAKDTCYQKHGKYIKDFNSTRKATPNTMEEGEADARAGLPRDPNGNSQYNHGFDQASEEGEFYIHYTTPSGERKTAGPFTDKAALTHALYNEIIYKADGNTKKGNHDITMNDSPVADVVTPLKTASPAKVYTPQGNDPRDLQQEQDLLFLDNEKLEDAIADGKWDETPYVIKSARHKIKRNKERMRVIDGELLATEKGLDWGPERNDTGMATVEKIQYTMDPNTGISRRVHPYWAPLNFARGFTLKEPNQQAQIMTRALRALRTPGPNGDPPSWIVADPTRKLNSKVTYEDEGRTARVGGKFKAYVIKDPPYTDPESGDHVPSRITFLLPEEY